MKLSPVQDSIRTAPLDRHIKVTAAPGSGKSTVAGYRIQYLIEEGGVAPSKILATMFNASAVEEFSEGLQDLGVEAGVKIRTYHSLALRIISELENKNRIPKLRLVTEEYEIDKLLRKAITNVAEGYPDANLFDPKIKENLAAFIGVKKSCLKSIYEVRDFMRLTSEYDIVLAAYEEFEDLRIEENIRTFDDLVYDLVDILNKDQDIRNAICNKLEHIIVDEYQDINEISNEMIRLLAGTKAKVMVVGDDDQTIYTWRGAEPQYLIDKFDEIFKAPILFKLENTYRYGHGVSLLANNTIQYNENRIDKQCISPTNGHYTEINIAYYSGVSDSSEIKSYHNVNQFEIVTEIKRSFELGINYEEIGILLRVFSLSPYIELALLQNQIPYQVEGTRGILFTPEYTAFNNILCLQQFKKPSVEQKTKWIRNVLNFPRLPVKKAIVNQVVSAFLLDDPLSEILSIIKPLKQYSYQAIYKRIKAVLELIEGDPEVEAKKVLEDYADKIVMNRYIRESTDDPEAVSRLRALFSSYVDVMAGESRSCKDALIYYKYLEHLYNLNQATEGGVKIQSVHSSKGLAYRTVIVPGLTEGIFPYVKDGEVTDIESERRLFFVAITRVRERLLLIIPASESYKKAASAYSEKITNTVEENETVSRFVYESNFFAVQRIAQALGGLKNRVREIRGCSRREEFNEYLVKIKSNLRVAK